MNSYVLDPFSVIIKLAILANKPVGSKLFIKNNALYINEPGVFQGITRFVVNSKKDDVQYLYNPIQYACKMFLTDDLHKETHKETHKDTYKETHKDTYKETHKDTYKELNKDMYKDPNKEFKKIINVFTMAKKGLKNLTETYKKNSIITLCLNYYIIVINNYLDKTIHKNICMEDECSHLYTKELLLSIKTIWGHQKIKYVLDIVLFLIDDPNATNNVKSLETFIYGLDNDFFTILYPKKIEPIQPQLTIVPIS
jgi:hypothetical protein